MLKLLFGISLSFLGFVSLAVAQQIANEPRYRFFDQPTPYYHGYGMNTEDDGCFPVSGASTEKQDLAAGCIFPTRPVVQKTANVIINKKVLIECSAYEYVASNPGEYQFCVFDGDKRVVTGYIVNGKYVEEQPKKRSFFAERAQVNRTTPGEVIRQNDKTQACVDCFVWGAIKDTPVTPALKKAKADSKAILDMAKNQAPQPLQQGSLPELSCTPKYSGIPTTNPDLYFYKKAEGVHDPVCSYNRYLDYKKFIKQASEKFNVSENALYCLLHRESRNTVYKVDANGNIIYTTNKKGKSYPNVDYVKDWDPLAVSHTGAVGIGQFLEKSFPDVTDRVLNYKDRNYSQKWSEYFSSLNRRVPTEDQLKVRSDITDRNAKKRCDARCEPDIAIAATALYLRYMMDQYGNNYENKNADLGEQRRLQSEKRLLQAKFNRTAEEQEQLKKIEMKIESAREYNVFMTGAYNRGQGAIEKAMDLDNSEKDPAKKKPVGVYQWQRNMVANNGGSNGEVDNHMKSIRNCMKALEN